MGKLITFVTILIFIDLLFLATGQLTIDSPSSVIIQSIQDPSNIVNFNWWSTLITGLSLLAATASVFVGIATGRSDLTIFIPIAITLSLLIGDYIFIYNYLNSLNSVLAKMSMGVITILFALIILEWTRGKD